MMLLDCQTCPVRDINCADCVVTALTLIPRPTEAQRSDRWATDDHSADARPQQSFDPSDRMSPSSFPAHPGRSLEPAHELPLDRAERRAVSALVAAGLVDVDEANAARAHSDAVPYVTIFLDDRHRHAN